MYVSIRDDIVMMLGFTDLLAGLAELEVDAVEMAVDRECHVLALAPGSNNPQLSIADVGDLAKLAQQRDEHKIKISAFLLATDFNARDLDSEIAWIATVARGADYLGVPAIRIDPILHGDSPVPESQRLDHMVSGLKRMLTATEGLKVGFGIENHGAIGNDPDFLEAIFKAVDSPRLGMTFDTGNFYWAGHPLSKVYSSIERLASHVLHTHVKNIKYPEAMREQQREMGYEYGKYCWPIAEGDIDHAKVVEILRAAGYKGDLCIEDESFGRYEFTQRVQNIKDAVVLLKRLAAG